MRFGSVCSGIEAASVAWHPLGWTAAWFSEIEPAPSAALAHRFPEVPNLGDMNALPGRIAAGEIEAPDVLCGGTPCQAFSVAGLRKSLDDARGNLSLTFCEIANAIDARRAAAGEQPCIIFWENVPGVLSTKDNAFGCFLAELAGEDDALVAPGGKWPNAGCVIGPQRAIAWRVLDAQYFGVAQRRRRVFVVASARDGFDPAAILFESEGVRRDTAPSREAGQAVAACIGTRTASGHDERGDNSSNLQPVAYAPDIARCIATREGSSQDYETTTMVAAYAFQPRIARNGRGDMGDVVNALTAQAGEDGRGDAAPCVAIAHVDTMPTLTSNGDAHSGYRDEHGLVPVCVTGDITHALKAEGADASEDGTGRGNPIVAQQVANTLKANNGGGGGFGSDPNETFIPHGMAVRRLTPRECERLQGFPDDWTLVPYRGRLMADGPRYKALGNSWAVPNVRWIGARIDAAVRGLNDFPLALAKNNLQENLAPATLVTPTNHITTEETTMSLEQALAENTAAIRELIALMSKTTVAASAPVAENKEPKAKAAKPEAKAEEKKPEPVAEQPKPEEKKPEAPKLEYGPVGAAITAFAAANGRDATLQKLATLGVKSGKELKPEQFAAALALFTAEEAVA